VNNILIVESDNDKYFVEALSNYLSLFTIEIDVPICNIADYECLNGLGQLEQKLIQVSTRIKKDNIEKIGIILDADKVGIEKRIELINDKLKNICEDVQLDKINDFKYSNELQVNIGCYIMNVDGKGELETVMKIVKLKDSTYADCLDSWKQCLEEKGKAISQKDFDKFWVSNYLRFDTCTKKEQKQANKNCRNEVAIKKDIWDFENPILDDLKDFLTKLNT